MKQIKTKICFPRHLAENRVGGDPHTYHIQTNRTSKLKSGSHGARHWLQNSTGRKTTLASVWVDGYAISAWGFLATIYRKRLQGHLDLGFKWVIKSHYLTSNHTIRTFVDVCSLIPPSKPSNGIVQTCCQISGNPLTSSRGQYQPSPDPTSTNPPLSVIRTLTTGRFKAR